MKLWSVEVLDFGNSNDTYIVVAKSESDAVKQATIEEGNQGYHVYVRELDVVDGFKINLEKID